MDANEIIADPYKLLLWWSEEERENAIDAIIALKEVIEVGKKKHRNCICANCETYRDKCEEVGI